MPLVTRSIEPRHLCRQTLPNVPNELECVTNITLANVIRQLGSLSKFAEDIFGELFTQANTFASRVSSLVERVDRLQVKVTQLDPKEEEVSLQGINTRKAFKSSTTQDQKLFDRDSLPVPVLETYSICNMPPPLNILSCYRDDGKEALKFYTDPSYFFDLWKEKMLQDTKDIMKRKHRKEKKDNPNRGNVNPRKIKTRKDEWEKMKMGQEFVELREKHAPGGYPANMVYQNGSIGSNESVEANYCPPPPQPDSVSSSPPPFTDDSLPPPPMEFSYPAHNQNTSGGLKKPGLVSPSHPPPAPPISSPQGARPGFAPPPAPPPPPPLLIGTPPPLEGFPAAGIPPPPSPPSFPPHPGFAAPPPPPPPASEYVAAPPPLLPPTGAGAPPPPPPPPPPGPPPSSFAGMDGPEAPLPPPDSVSSKAKSSLPAVSDARSDLLSAIRQGFQLRKVEEQREQEKRDVVVNDVATILARRIAVEYSDSEDDSSELEDEWSD
ncbi:wiskott-Aldrich syndrome protein family member 2 isoform X2 [Varanus komodoensis]|uniref:wiskott-Aldrich syndrome protein family member 2 isoform X2 n=1 Tax=Varanus komodoensis TaxID=61221 RepID=UPI001CF78D2D|nr:wiskott-Aldrich syndrome protein family member 2 isoform X2 [Varanus komodoensis]